MKTVNALIFGVAIVLAAFLLGNAYMGKSKPRGAVNVKGMSSVDFTSDLIVWSGSFEAVSPNIQEAYATLKEHKKVIKNYLISKGVSENDIVFEAIRTDYRYKEQYSPEGKYLGRYMVAYELSQTIVVSSSEVEKVEKVSREVTELLDQGINFYSNDPSYYYSKLEDLKLELISQATENAHLRAEKIASNSSAKLGKLISANMGIFQITGLNSNEDYTWGGTFNVSSKEKTASVTVTLKYTVR